MGDDRMLRDAAKTPLLSLRPVGRHGRGKSAKRVFELLDPAIHLAKMMDARV